MPLMLVLRLLMVYSIELIQLMGSVESMAPQCRVARRIIAAMNDLGE